MDENKGTVEDGNIEETGKVGTQANQNKDEGKAEKTYTQEEYNALDRKLKAKYEKKYSGIDIAKYNEWVESQKTAEQKQAEKEAEYQRILNENKSLKNEKAVIEAGVKKDFVRFVSSEVSQMEGDFSENLAKFLKENTQYTSTKEVIKTVGTSAKLDGTTRTENTTNQIMNDIIRSARD